MSADTQINAQWVPQGNSAFPPQQLVGLAASSQPGRGQYVTIAPATGFASLNDGTTPNQIAGGVAYPTVFSGTSAVAGAALLDCWIGYGNGNAASTINGDGFTVADQMTPFWIADENTPGRLSNYSGSNRSLGGFVCGVDTFGYPVTVSGPVPWAIARGLLIANDYTFASFAITDAAASTTTAERVIPWNAAHGLITGVEFSGAAIAADNTDYVTVTFKRYTSADNYAAGTTVATYDSRAANQGAITAIVPAECALSAVAHALDSLEDSVYTITVAKGGAGKSLIGAFRVKGKVQ